MKSRLLIIIAISTSIIFFIIGWNEIEIEGNIVKEQCNIDFDYYYVEPVIKNVWECHNPFVGISPCGTVKIITT